MGFSLGIEIFFKCLIWFQFAIKFGNLCSSQRCSTRYISMRAKSLLFTVSPTHWIVHFRHLILFVKWRNKHAKNQCYLKNKHPFFEIILTVRASDKLVIKCGLCVWEKERAAWRQIINFQKSIYRNPCMNIKSKYIVPPPPQHICTRDNPLGQNDYLIEVNSCCETFLWFGYCPLFL